MQEKGFRGQPCLDVGFAPQTTASLRWDWKAKHQAQLIFKTADKTGANGVLSQMHWAMFKHPAS